MAGLKTLLVISMLYMITRGDDNRVPPGPPNPFVPTPNLNTTTTSTTTVPTPSNNTTTTTTTPSTTTTPTTTVTPPTSPPNTTTTTKTTTTPLTTTTTTTTVQPTTTPPPLTPGKWSVNYTNSNRTCLVLDAAIHIVVTYTFNNKTNTYSVNVPPAAVAVGRCDPNTENITLQFGDNNNNYVSFNIQKNNSTKKYDVDSIQVMLKADLPNITQLLLTHGKNEFATPLSNSYKCEPEKSLNLTAKDASSSYSGELHISHFQMQAFRNSTNQKFDEALDCESSETPDVVPIAVGCALAALVIIVLIAYLIGRRRSQARGYLSMFPQTKREEDYIPMKNLSCFN